MSADSCAGEPFSVARRGRAVLSCSSWSSRSQLLAVVVARLRAARALLAPVAGCRALYARTARSFFVCRARKFSARNGVSSFRVELLSCVPVIVSEPILGCHSIFSYPATSVVVKCVCCRELAPGAHSVSGLRFLQLGQAGHRSVLCTSSFLLASAPSRLARP
jgi:hypothetical protein